MKASKQRIYLGILVLLVVRASAARPWLSRSILSDGSRLSSVQEQLRQNQLRRLRIVHDSEEELPVQPSSAYLGDSFSNDFTDSFGYGLAGLSYGERQTGVYGFAGLSYGDRQIAGYGESLSSAPSRPLLAPMVSYTDSSDVQAVVQAGASWQPSAVSIELPSAPVKESGHKHHWWHQFHDEGNEVMVGPVPAIKEAGQRASRTQQFYEEGDEIVRGPVRA